MTNRKVNGLEYRKTYRYSVVTRFSIGDDEIKLSSGEGIYLGTNSREHHFLTKVSLTRNREELRIMKFRDFRIDDGILIIDKLSSQIWRLTPQDERYLAGQNIKLMIK